MWFLSMFVFLMNGCFYCVRFSFLSSSQDHLQNDLLCVELGVIHQLI